MTSPPTLPLYASSARLAEDYRPDRLAVAGTDTRSRHPTHCHSPTGAAEVFSPQAYRQTVDYDEYMNSPLWVERRRRYWATQPKVCTACGTADTVDLHHMEYDAKQRGEECDEVLLPLCRPHHDEVHILHDANSDMMTLRQATVLIVEENGGESPPAGVPMRKPRNTDRWLDHVSGPCPACGASAGQPCVRVNAHGRQQAIRMVHKDRKAASRRPAREI